ncbi:PREDICTED: uncharacterized protein LOC104808823 [Tarenaya hassleriana]|uniref:uncharacterized protein LOC104808823 n=1 Tax=Tarenaya hassleriana TaxID=28532 RepID=UPI00053C7EA7|nr:PREDICTED: uncharacterized protein LOC104808823 [Tarenaya hassleriana]
MEGNLAGDEKMAKPIGPTPEIQKRVSAKSRSLFDYPVWKKKLRENCFRRVREDRTRLLWKMRLSNYQSPHEKDFIKSAFQDIVYDEMKKIKDSSRHLSRNPQSSPESDDILWEYEGISDAYEGDSEEILLEMQRIFYEDLVPETTTTGSHIQTETWEDEEDVYLATLVFENMHLNGEQEHHSQIWCPICKQGELQENHRHIYCSLCQIQLNKDDEVNLSILRERLAEVHAEHLAKGCRLRPKFCIQVRFDLKALYIMCDHCNTFDIVI